MLPTQTVQTIRETLVEKYLRGEIVTNDTGSLSGADTVEIVGASFIADAPVIFGTLNHKYIQNELDWYISRSLNVNDIPNGAPAIWKAVATPKGEINSNYGFLIFDKANGSQCLNVIDTLVASPESRRATMIYTRPTMHNDFNREGMSDFVCTNAVQYLIRRGRLDVVVQMRSNDCIFGFANDMAWQLYVQDFVRKSINERTDFNLELGDIHWQAASLHIYEKHFYHLDHFIKTGEHHGGKPSKIIP
jgi:thymidylate synthase